MPNRTPACVALFTTRTDARIFEDLGDISILVFHFNAVRFRSGRCWFKAWLNFRLGGRRYGHVCLEIRGVNLQINEGISANIDAKVERQGEIK